MPGANRIRYVGDAFRVGMAFEEIRKLSGTDPWFLAQIEDLIHEEKVIAEQGLATMKSSACACSRRKGLC